ncbi:DUF72 domain-containing protein [Pseudoalteromonas xiamenensis]|jgi:uncharacterized protein YecE (DUF72 family)|uniref:DUF72 domain-containing protein n=1 Tax=Pseudoalteromonas xiamenensis TaxID=882626 RepID=UPI0035E944DB
MLYLGCPQWSSNHWKGNCFSQHVKAKDMLHEYAQVFNSVEGNTTFYADPQSSTIQNWYDSVPDDFRFTFKLPKRFSHESGLRPDKHALLDWFKLMAPLLPKLGQVMLQLPASVGPQHVDLLFQFIKLIPDEFPMALEVRHPLFFKKGEEERKLNRLLIDRQINRIIMDTRPLFSEAPCTPAIIDAQRKKPRLPVNVIATSTSPIVRFVGCDTRIDNRAFYAPWLDKIRVWLQQGKSPYVFFHTADNIDSPFLARQFIQDLGVEHQVLSPFPAEKEIRQDSLF